MNTVAFDTLAFAKRLQEAGVPTEQAEAHAGAQADFLTHHLLSEVATKSDLRALEAATKADLKALQAATKIDIQTLRADMKAGQDKMEGKLEASLANTKADFAALKTDIAELETKLTMRMLLMVGALATLMTLFKFIE